MITVSSSRSHLSFLTRTNFVKSKWLLIRTEYSTVGGSTNVQIEPDIGAFICNKVAKLLVNYDTLN